MANVSGKSHVLRGRTSQRAPLVHTCGDQSVYQRMVGIDNPRNGVFEAGLDEPRPLQTNGLLENALNSIPLQVIILNRLGRIVDWNRAWAAFLAKNGVDHQQGLVGTSYRHFLAKLGDMSVAKRISDGIAMLLSGRDGTFSLDYSLHIAAKRRSFRMHANRFFWNGEVKIVVTNEELTGLGDTGRPERESPERQASLQEEERQRIAKELHDSTAQNLAAVGLNLIVLRSQASGDSGLARIWDDTESCLNEVLRELRSMTYLLYTPQLQSEGLRHSLHRFVEGFAARAGLAVKTRITPAVDRIPLPVQRSSLRIVQEALSNVHRHADATRVVVDLRFFSKRLFLTVIDNGCGIRGMIGEVETESFRPGVGLRGMRARVHELGGKLKIISRANGARILVAIPVAVA